MKTYNFNTTCLTEGLSATAQAAFLAADLRLALVTETPHSPLDTHLEVYNADDNRCAIVEGKTEYLWRG